MSNDIDINVIAEKLNDKADRDLGNILLTNDALVQLRYLINDLDLDGAINVTATTNDNVSYYTAPSDGIFIGESYAAGRLAVNGVRLTNDVTSTADRCSFMWFPLKKGDTVTYWGGNWGGAGTQKFIPYKHQAGTNAQLLDGLNYQGKYATVNALLQVSPTHGRWALVGNDSNGYNRYFTRPTDNSFTTYEWADGGKDITVGDYVVDWKNPTTADPTWYRLYKSGWVEQGGNYTGSTDGWITISLLKEMQNTVTYRAVVTRAVRTGTGDPGTGGWDRRAFTTNNYKNDSFDCWGIWAGIPAVWYVSGMSAQG